MLRAVDPSRFEAVTIRVRLDDYACRPQINSRGTREPAACHARLDAVGKRKSAVAIRDAARALTTGGACISIDDDFPRPTRQDLEEALQTALAGRPIKEVVTPAIGCSLADIN